MAGRAEMVSSGSYEADLEDLSSVAVGEDPWHETLEGLYIIYENGQVYRKCKKCGSAATREG